MKFIEFLEDNIVTIMFFFLVVGFSGATTYVVLYSVEPQEPQAPQESQGVLVSDRITACENAGGKYRLYFSEYDNDYREGCERIETEIEDF